MAKTQNKNRKPKDAPRENMQDQFYTRVLHRAYLRDGDITHTGEALALALLFHAKAKPDAKLMNDVKKMMGDVNS